MSQYEVEPRSGNPDQGETKEPVRIMMADDHFPDVVLVKEALRSNGITFQMDVCNDGDSALEYVNNAMQGQNKPDLIILDLHLSQISGLEVLKEIRTRQVFDDTPVAMLTSSLSPAKRAQAIQLKADAYIAKPSHLAEFLSMVGSALSDLLNRHPHDVPNRA